MNAILNALRHPLAERFAWSLLHLIWQGTAVALLLGGVLWLLRRRSANTRYLTAGLSLLALPGLLALTFAWNPRPIAKDDADAEQNQLVSGGRPSALHVPAQTKRTPGEPAESNTPASKVLQPNLGIDNVTAPDGDRRGRSPEPQPVLIEPESGAVTTNTAFEDPAKPQAEGWQDRLANSVSPWLPEIVGAWIVGLCAISVWHFLGWLTLRRLRRNGVEPVSDSALTTLSRLRNRLGIRLPVELLQSSRVCVPAMFGCLKPVILLPGSVITGLTAQQLEAVLAHELAHIRRHDYFCNLVQTAIETLLFFHPAVWWISRRIRIEREHCCDDVALALTNDPLLYAQSLTRVEELRHQPASPQPALTVAASGGSLLDRVCRILGTPRHKAPQRGRVIGVTGATGLIAMAAALALLLPGLVSESPAVTAGTSVAPGDDDVPSTRLGDLTVLHVLKIADLKSGATLPLGNGEHRFDDIPDYLKGRRFTRRGGYQGILRFRVEKAQRVYFAVYGADWGGGGNDSGGWKKELVTRQQLKKQGWRVAGKLVGEHTLIDGNRLAWIVYTRECKAGETFAIRTHKYQAPILFSAKLKADGGEKTKPIPKPAKPIDLGRRRVRIELNPGDTTPGGLYTVGPYGKQFGQAPDAKNLYLMRRSGKVPAGNLQLVGRVPNRILTGAKFETVAFERTGKTITLRIRYVHPWPEGSFGSQAAYFRARLPQWMEQSTLPPGTYNVRVEFEDFRRTREGKAVRDSDRKRPAVAPMNCRLVVPAKGVFAEIWKLVNAAVDMKPNAVLRGPRAKSDQNPTGLEFGPILKLTGQDRDRANFTKDHRFFGAGVNALVKGRKTWAVCSLLDHPNVDARIHAARGLKTLADPHSVPALLAAAKANNHIVAGSENATLHMIYRIALKSALVRITGQQLTPKGLKVTTTVKGMRRVIRSDDDPKNAAFGENVDFAAVERWLQTVFLTDSAARKSTNGVLKQLTSAADRGKLTDIYEKIRAGKPVKRDELAHVYPLEKMPPRDTAGNLEAWFKEYRNTEFRVTDKDNNWLLFRSRQVNDLDRMWVDRIERRGNEFIITMSRAVWNGFYTVNMTYHDLHALNLGKLSAGKYTAKWIINRSSIKKLDDRGQPKVIEAAKSRAVELKTEFEVHSAKKDKTTPATGKAGGTVYEDKARGFRLTIPKGWSATPASYAVQHYRDVFLCINSRGNKALRVVDQRSGDTVEYSPRTVAAQLTPGTVYLDLAYFEGPGGRRNVKGKPDTVDADLSPLLKQSPWKKVAGGKFSKAVLSFIKGERAWHFYAYIREPAAPSARAQAESVLRSFRFTGTQPKQPGNAGEQEKSSQKLDKAVQRGLKYLSSVQTRSGAWQTGDRKESVALTALAVRAFLAAGHKPGKGKYGKAVDRAVQWLLKQTRRTPAGIRFKTDSSQMYEHAICTMVLAELIGHLDKKRADACRLLVRSGVALIANAQDVKKAAMHTGGWRYKPTSRDSDLSVTGWQLQALWAAREAGIKVDKKRFAAAADFLKRCATRDGGFSYQAGRGNAGNVRTGIAILSLSLCGRQKSVEVTAGIRYLAARPIRIHNSHYYCGVYYAFAGLKRIGGKPWTAFRTAARKELLDAQRGDGSWRDRSRIGSDYATAMAILALCVERARLPMFGKPAKEKTAP